MKRSKLLMSVLGSSLMLGGAMFTAPRVTHSSSMWYLAGQVKMALGDTTGGLQLMSRAAKQRQQEQGIASPTTKPATTQARHCGNRSQSKPAVAVAKPQIENAKAKASAFNPKVMLASLKIPAGPFGAQDVAMMSPDQVRRATEQYEKVIQRWTAEQNAHVYETAMLQRAVEQTKAFKARHPQVMRVIVPPEVFPEAAPESPMVTP